ncbi:Uncharacterized protein OBRU01_11676 [Operophtera brumata]|uniref:THAP-type domain-containing protein n=1 Tax=Operophtera brumata TaxID=104452 RepID=A0A0L7L7F5_OPEBR|nr:Uncharacterized protein OBRU01_11676 [Operophtera brumata]
MSSLRRAPRAVPCTGLIQRKKWLELINRPDLINPQTKPTSHIVCSLHFDKSMLKIIPRLKPDALPTKLLPNQPIYANTNEGCKDVSTQTEESFINVLSGVTEFPKTKSSEQTTSGYAQNDTTQKPLALPTARPRKRKLHGELEDSEEKRRKLQNDLHKIKEVNSKEPECYKRFSLKCEDEVSKRFVKLLEWQSKLKSKSKGKRYDLETKLFALNLHFSNPQTYRCLQTFIHLPSESVLQRFNMVVPPKFEDRILNFLSSKLKSMPDNAKYCTLCIDEMDLQKQLHYDTRRDEMIGHHNINGNITKEIASHGYVVMLRGVVVDWKQPIAYSFSASPKHYKELESWLDKIMIQILINMQKK